MSLRAGPASRIGNLAAPHKVIPNGFSASSTSVESLTTIPVAGDRKKLLFGHPQLLWQTYVIVVAKRNYISGAKPDSTLGVTGQSVIVLINVPVHRKGCARCKIPDDLGSSIG